MPEPEAFRAPKGTQDVLPPESAHWERLVGAFSELAGRYGFGLLQSPMFEDTGVFRRLGEGTDVVRKEMYDFEDKGGRHIALRPEGTASVVRAYVQHRPVLPWKVYYVAPSFRYEAPQAGRLRQHHQVGVEVLGSSDPDIDVEVVALAATFLRSIGLRRVLLLLNSMGTPHDRAGYVDDLRTYLEAHRGDLAPEDADKVESHPLRVLDSSRAATLDVVRSAPMLLDRLSSDAAHHFDRVQQGLGALDIDFAIEPRLVRGLDYYTHTTFEFQASGLDHAQSTVLGGGRYDGLAEQLGGPATPGIGFGSGVERILLACEAEECLPDLPPPVDVWVVDFTGGTQARDLTAVLRAAGLRADRSFDQRAPRAQMKAANRAGAPVAVIVGEQEVKEDTVAVREMGDGGEQTSVPRADMVDAVRRIIEGADSE